ncbi:MAG: Fe-Mn family superoxide dismutase [Nitrososphaeraceae archaeon]
MSIIYKGVSYYLDYKKERGKFIEALYNIVNWNKLNKKN